jgi:hypothetical protein
MKDVRLVPCLLVLVLSAHAEDPKPLTEDECLGFARKLEKEVAKGDIDAVLARFDWDALLDRVTAGVDADDPFVRQYRQTFVARQRTGGDVVPVIVDGVRRGGSHTLLRVYEKGGSRRALFRFLPPGGFNYHECLLARSKDGRVRIADVYVFLSGENASDSLRRLFLPAAAEASKGLLEKLLTSESDMVKYHRSILAISGYTREGRPAEAMRVYRSLPESVQREKCVLLLRLLAAQKLGEKEHAAGLDGLHAQYPDDPCHDLLAINFHILGRRHDEALAAVDRLEQAVGGDPYLVSVRGDIHYAKGDGATAARYAKEAIGAEPTLAAPHWTLVRVSLAERKFDETVKLLLRIEETLGLEVGNLTKVPGYADFVKSPEHKDWLERKK